MERHVLFGFLCFLVAGGAAAEEGASQTPWIEVSEDAAGFAFTGTGEPFAPWGVNYDHDREGRLLEAYWVQEWPVVVEDFEEMKRLGANVVRIHLQFEAFMEGPTTPKAESLEQLGRLTQLAERLGVYLDVTGLACYHKQDVPAWYDALSEQERWDAQACFWQAIAGVCAASPMIFCYDLMNEPVVPGGLVKSGDWLPGEPFGGKHFVQYITLDLGGRARHEVARQWMNKLRTAIRQRDSRHMITAGLVPWSLDRPGLTSGFVPERIVDEVDFICVHIYPERDKVDEALDTLRGFAVGKPVLVEEMFPLKCGIEQLEQFVERSRGVAAGWIGFYWGQTPEELDATTSMADGIVLSWLEFFEEGAKEYAIPAAPAVAEPHIESR
jgi:hypothetical protein